MAINVKQGALGATVAFAAVTTLLVFTPFAIWLGNRAEFSSEFVDIAVLVTPVVVVFAGISGLIVLLMPERVGTRLVAMLAALTITLWAQANLAAWDYGPLDGKLIDWTEGSWRGVVDTLMWLVLSGTAVLLPSRYMQRLTQFALIVWLLQATTLTASYLGLTPPPAKNQTQIDMATAATFSRSGNVLHIVADGFQSDVFGQLLQENDGAFKRDLSGFKFFADHTSAFPYTQMALPALLNGETYHNHTPVQSFSEETLGGDSILRVAGQLGYEVQLVVPNAGLGAAYARIPDVSTMPVTRRLHLPERALSTLEGSQLIDLALFRSTPHFLKAAIYNQQNWLLQAGLNSTNLESAYFFSHTRALELMTSHMAVDDGPLRYKYVHLLLSHTPMVAARDCTYVGAPLAPLLEPVTNQSRCTLQTLTALFKRMKELDVYDQTNIILMSDHGAWLAPSSSFEVPHPLKDGQKINPLYFGLARALFAVKPAGASGTLQLSNAPTSIIDTPNTIADMISAPATYPGLSVFKVDPSAPRTRHFYIYEYERKNWFEDDYLAPMMRFTINGNAAVSDSWKFDQLFAPSE